MTTPTPYPTPGPYPGVPDPGTRPTTTPAPSPGPAPGTATDYPKQGDPAPGQPGLIDKAADALKDAIPGFGVVSDFTDGITAVRKWISNRHNWTRVAWFAGGSAMFTIGAVMVGERPLSQGITSVVQPVGKVVKSAYKG